MEKILIENGHARTAKEFLLYRAERTRIRDMNTRLMRIYSDLTFKDAKENDIKRENANIDGDTAMGTMLKYGSEGSKLCEWLASAQDATVDDAPESISLEAKELVKYKILCLF